MKNTGIVRRVDELGRVTLPMEIRNQLDIQEKDALEIYVDNDSIILSKNEKSCIFCGNDKNLTSVLEKSVCNKCIKKITKIGGNELWKN